MNRLEEEKRRERERRKISYIRACGYCGNHYIDMYRPWP